MRSSSLALVPLAVSAVACAAPLPEPVPALAAPPPEVAAPIESKPAPLAAAPSLDRRSEPPSRGGGPENRSCDGKAGAGNDCQGESCCARLPVPGGDFDMRLDVAGKTERVHVAGFAMDKFEVTVGRIRAWVRAGQPLPKEGEVLYDDGKHPAVVWPKGAAVQTEKQLAGWKRYDTWTGGDDRRPKNAISWYTAAAFCHFDGGRLPTDAEWKYASAGGDEQRPYPWGSAAPSPEHAVYNCTGDGNQSCSIDDILPVGSRPKGDGRWGHRDLAGSMFEWTLAGSAAESGGAGAGEDQTSRGGGFCYIGGVDRRAKTALRPDVFRKEPPTTLSHMVGARCAYDVKGEGAGGAGGRAR